MKTSDLLRDMVEIYSPSGEEKSLVDFLAPKMEDLGYRVRRDEVGNLIGRIGQGETQVLLLGHLDTVEGEIPVRVEDGRLYGRGSVDAKGPLANFIGSARRFRDSTELEILVIGVVEEESSSKGAYAILEQASPDYVVVGEPSRWNGITLGYRGSTRITYTLKKPKTHRGEGSSIPAEEAVEFYKEVQELFEDETSGFYGTDVRLTNFQTRDEPFSDSVRMELDVRTGPGFDYDSLSDFVEKEREGARIERTRGIPPVKTSKRNKLVSSFLSGIRSAGGEPKFKLKTGTADMNILAEHWDVPMIAYGPGDSSLDHTPRERLELEELSLAKEVLTEALKVLEGATGK
ncbi:MAG: [LysW]-lysine hydrolase [Candidatus Bipolaricaulota bacterium]